MGGFSFCCKDNASAEGFGRLRDAVGDEGLGARLVEDVDDCGPGLPETALEGTKEPELEALDIDSMGPSSMSNIASESA
jgi:hypothetical protein